MSQIDRDAIAARAFALYVRRGRQPGRSMEDWLEAERQLKADVVAATGAPAQRSTLTTSLTSSTPPRPLPPAGSPREATSLGKPAGSAVPEVLASKPTPAAPKPGSSKPPVTQLPTIPTMKPLPMPPRPTPPAAAAPAKSKAPAPPPPQNKKNGGKKR